MYVCVCVCVCVCMFIRIPYVSAGKQCEPQVRDEISNYISSVGFGCGSIFFRKPYPLFFKICVEVTHVSRILRHHGHSFWVFRALRPNTLQHTATHCSTTHCTTIHSAHSTLQHTSQHTATRKTGGFGQ